MSPSSLMADDLTRARKEVDKGREAIKAIRALLPRTTVRTTTTAPKRDPRIRKSRA